MNGKKVNPKHVDLIPKTIILTLFLNGIPDLGGGFC